MHSILRKLFCLFLLFIFILFISGCTGYFSPEQPNSYAEENSLERDSSNTSLPQQKRFSQLQEALRRAEEEGASEEFLLRIRANLERWKLFSSSLEEVYLEVNIPAYTATIYENDQPLLQFRVIVGRIPQPTPILRGDIQYIELNPIWEVPRSIAIHEILPKLKSDPSYLRKNHMEVFAGDGQRLNPDQISWRQVSGKSFPYHIHQVPGPWNAVGSIKFIFPNSLNIFLHGSPSLSLFQETQRTFSHGCVRVEDPLTLAAFAMRDSAWTRERLEEMLKSKITRRLKLPAPLPVYLSYWTVWVNEDGTLGTAPDIYGRDPKWKGSPLDENR